MGDAQTFGLAVALVKGFDLPAAQAWELLQEYNADCSPPWGEPDLRRKLTEARKSKSPSGYLLGEGPADDPSPLARSFLAGGVWRFWRESFWRYDGTRYVETPAEDISAALTRHIEAELEAANARDKRQREGLEERARGAGGRAERAKKRLKGMRRSGYRFSTALLGNVRQLVKSRTILAAETAMPSMLGAEAQRDILPLRNGLLDLESGGLLPHTPDFFSRVCLPCEFDAAAACREFLSRADRICGGDAERVALLQEWFGYSLARTTNAQRFLILVGEGGNGKSVLCAALEAVLGGADNVSSVSLEAFGERFGLTPTLGRLANVVADLSELDRVAEGHLKKYTSGELMTFDRKGLSPVEARPTARPTLATNIIPRFSDRSEGLNRRAILFPCKETIAPHERVFGMDKPDYWRAKGELPGMLNWALGAAAAADERLAVHGACGLRRGGGGTPAGQQPGPPVPARPLRGGRVRRAGGVRGTLRRVPHLVRHERAPAPEQHHVRQGDPQSLRGGERRPAEAAGQTRPRVVRRAEAQRRAGRLTGATGRRACGRSGEAGRRRASPPARPSQKWSK